MCHHKDVTVLWKDILYNQKQAWFTMSSGSMAPLMPTGSQIFVTSLENEKIKLGDIVLYSHQNQLIAHRVLWIRRHHCLQGGDRAVSPSFIALDTIIGIVQKIKINDKEFDLNQRSAIVLSGLITLSSLGIMAVRRIFPRLGQGLHYVKIGVLRVMMALR
ncbi:MAG: S26 family signal peptidase [Thiomargarita sp.]|nr:S26 family signal peptidase [Thiomargarita sp.]